MTQTQSETGTELYRTTALNRRNFMRAGVGAAAAGAIGAGSMRSDYGPTQDAEAIAPLVAAGYVAAGVVAGGAVGASLGWLLREHEILGSNPPAEGLTLDALHQHAYDTLRARRSYNDSNFLQTEDYVDGIKDNAYTEAKIVGIEGLNEQKSQSDIQDDMSAEVDAYETTVKKNFLRSFGETAEELAAIGGLIEDHPDVELEDWTDSNVSSGDYPFQEFGTETESYTLPDGSTFEITQFAAERSTNSGSSWSAWDPATDNSSWDVTFIGPDGQELDMVWHDDWQDHYDDIVQTFQDVRDGLILWLDNVYNDVQAGELDIDDLITPRERAAMMSEDENFNQAVADLFALNVAFDLEREAEIHLPDVDATVYGSLAYTGEGAVSTGTIEPDSEDGSYYLTYDISQGEGEWSAYDGSKGVDGGEVHFNSQPFPDTRYHIHTVAGETATVTADDFTAFDDGGDEFDGFDESNADYWEVNVSDQLDDAVTDIDHVTYAAKVDETQYETVRLNDTFEIVTFRDSEGEEHDDSEFTKTEPQDDENYITQEEWDDLVEANEQLIQDYEDAQGGGGGISIGDDGWLNDLFGGVSTAALAIVAGIVALLALLSD